MSFIPLEDNSAIRTNPEVIKKNTTNILEFNIYLDLIDDGIVTFTYQKATILTNGTSNGVLKFDVGFHHAIIDDNILNAEPQTVTVNLKKGFNELIWYYTFTDTGASYNLFAEITVSYLH